MCRQINVTRTFFEMVNKKRRRCAVAMLGFERPGGHHGPPPGRPCLSQAKNKDLLNPPACSHVENVNVYHVERVEEEEEEDDW